MKIILIILLTCSAIRAQVPHIDYVIADEAKSQLQIHGTFPSDTTGFVTIENTKQTVRFWSDTMLICDLPDSGAGAGGHVIMQQMGGMSNARMLSIFKLEIYDGVFEGSVHGWLFLGNSFWKCSWRTDIGIRSPSNSIFAFESSKISFGHVFNWNDVGWRDSSAVRDSSMALIGHIDLRSNYFFYGNAELRTYNNFYPRVIAYQFHQVSFDSLGTVQGYVDDGESFGQKYHDSVVGHIIFPPAIKNSVSLTSEITSNPIKIFSPIGSEDHQIPFEAEDPLGETTASLYSIDGRLLKRDKLFIPSAGIYSFDASGINTRFGILVFKTERGIFARKVLL